ncbi:alpha/beta fold hydrolase [Massilia putida]|uniref:alpha/beta fold hydrolase n=1 Tax=Massilia putida TaxID=1141883 RepID=UPI000952B601|nr:alpha/beta fold hydrolase [Massilia putida]
MERFATRDGVDIAYRIDGRGNLPWLVFSNSLATNLSMWDRQVDYLRRHFRILRYDQRGHGGSAVPAEPCTFDLLIDDLVALMDHVAIERAALVGVSMGAVTVLGVAARHPRRVERVLACDGQWVAPPGAAHAWEERIAIACDAGMAALAGPTAARWLTASFMARPSAALDDILHMIAATPAEGFIRCARALQAYDLREEITGIRVPCMLLAGAEDGGLPAVMRRMAEAIPGAAYAEIGEAGHLPNLERPVVFNTRISSFLLGGQAQSMEACA